MIPHARFLERDSRTTGRRELRVLVPFLAVVFLAILPVGVAFAQPAPESYTKKLDLTVTFSQAKAGVNGQRVVVQEMTQKNFTGTELPSKFFLPLGNFRAVEVDSNGKATGKVVDSFTGSPLTLTVIISRGLYEQLRSVGISEPTIYFWNPTGRRWVDARRGSQGAYVLKPASVREDNAKNMVLQVHIYRWPAGDPACGFGG